MKREHMLPPGHVTPAQHFVGCHVVVVSRWDMTGFVVYVHLLQGRVVNAPEDVEVVASRRRIRWERRLKQIDIPADEIIISDEILGKGGFGTVYTADYNGRNSAAKVLDVDIGGTEDYEQKDDDCAAARERVQRRNFVHALEVITRLCSPHTVQVYGAVTALNGKFVLVMELLSGGDLRSFLKRCTESLPDSLVRQIIRDVFTGVGFLHSKATIHGSLKSANVLFDGEGRAKVRIPYVPE